MGTLNEPVPVTGLAENLSPMPRMAPPPLGKEMAGAEGALVSVVLRVSGFWLSLGDIGGHLSTVWSQFGCNRDR